MFWHLTPKLQTVQISLTWLQSLSVAQTHKAGVVHLGLCGNNRWKSYREHHILPTPMFIMPMLDNWFSAPRMCQSPSKETELCWFISKHHTSCESKEHQHNNLERAFKIYILQAHTQSHVCAWLTECTHFLCLYFQITCPVAFHKHSSHMGFDLILTRPSSQMEFEFVFGFSCDRPTEWHGRANTHHWIQRNLYWVQVCCKWDLRTNVIDRTKLALASL